MVIRIIKNICIMIIQLYKILRRLSSWSRFCLVFSECPFMSEPNAEYIQAQQAKLVKHSLDT